MNPFSSPAEWRVVLDDLEVIAIVLRRLHTRLGFAVNLTWSPNPLAPSLVFSCSMSDPRPVQFSVPIFGWGPTPKDAFREALHHRAKLAAEVDLDKEARRIKAHFEALAEDEISRARTRQTRPLSPDLPLDGQ